MKRRNFLPVLFAGLFFSSSVDACISPEAAYSSGVLFNNGEGFNLTYFDSLGTEGTHFFRDCRINDSDLTAKDVIILTPDKKPLDWNDMVTIQNVTLTNSLLQIEVKYGGGCNSHEFVLYSDCKLTESNPPILKFTLLHNANGDACKALITETLVFNIKPAEALHPGSTPLNIHINNINTGIKWYLGNTCAIRYRSHYNPEAMVYLDFTVVNITKTLVSPSMKIITNPDVEYFIGFDYARAVATELKWLINQKIITGVTDVTVSRIEEVMKNRMGLFWTFQDTLLAYNAFYLLTIDTTGKWNWGDLIVERNGCGEEIKFTLPADSLMYGTTSVKKRPEKSNERSFGVKMSDNSISINFYRNLPSPAQIEIINLNGKLLHKVSVPANQNSFVMKSPIKPGRGIYQMIVHSKEFRETGTLIITE
jgi:hypothetical protein